MLFTRRNVVLCLSMVLTAASLASVVQATNTTNTTCTPSLDNPKCIEQGWYGYDGACYKFFHRELTFKEAGDYCIDVQGAWLVSIHSREELEKVTCLMPSDAWVRISLETRSVLS